MMDNDFDPYDILMMLNDRLNRLERAHNGLCDAVKKTDIDLSVALHSIRHLQQNHVKLSSEIHQYILNIRNQP